MRAILFKARRVDGKGWVEGSLIQPLLNKTSIREHSWHPQHGYLTYTVIPETVCQFTGLTDKNGKMIFEGDVTKWGQDEYKIVFKDGCFCYVNEYEEEVPLGIHEHTNLDQDTSYSYVDGVVDYMEVIGNVNN